MGRMQFEGIFFFFLCAAEKMTVTTLSQVHLLTASQSIACTSAVRVVYGRAEPKTARLAEGTSNRTTNTGNSVRARVDATTEGKSTSTTAHLWKPQAPEEKK